MIKASAGTWLNYATTLLFQVLFAAHYGTTAAASSFVIAFGVAVSIAGVLVSGVQSVIVPRMLDRKSAYLADAVRFLGALTCGAFIIACLIALGSKAASQLLTEMLHIQGSSFADLLAIGAAFLFLQFVAGELAAIGLAKGHRFLPAAAPLFPSVIGSIALVVSPHLDVRLAFIALVLGSVFQVVALAATLRPPYSLSNEPIPGLAQVALAMGAVYGLLALLPGIERLMAAYHHAAGAAQYDYASRSLRAVQQLVLGGLFLAALGAWSSEAVGQEVAKLKSSVASSAILAGTFLAFASSMAIVSGRSIVALLFQHGNFGPTDTTAVTRILLLALPGFWCEGLGLVLSSGLLARKQNWTLIRIGVANFLVRIVLMTPLAIAYGAIGVAIAYSADAALMLVLLISAIRNAQIWPGDMGGSLVRALAVGVGTIATAVFVALVGRYWPTMISTATVVGTFALLFATFRPVVTFRLLPR